MTERSEMEAALEAILFVSSSLPVAREAASRTLVIDDGRLVEEQPTEALIAQIIVSKFADHTPLYRQAEIFRRHGPAYRARSPR